MSVTMGLFTSDYHERQREAALSRARELRREYAHRAERWDANTGECQHCGRTRHVVRGYCCCCWDDATGWSAAHGEHVCGTVRSRYGHLLRQAARLERRADGFPR